MTAFILTAIALTLVAVYVLIRPLLKPYQGEDNQRRTQNIQYARERLSELQAQLESEEITSAEHADFKAEVEANLAADLDLANASIENVDGNGSNVPNAVIVTLVCCLVPFSALGLYLLTGNSQAISGTQMMAPASSASTAATGEAANADIDSLLSSLEQKLQSNPEDKQGWTVLARTYQQLGRYSDSVKAYKTLLELDPKNPDVYAGLADASALQAGGILAGQPASYVHEALKLDAQHAQALWLAGLAEVQDGNHAPALEYWDRLMPLLAEFPQQQAELRDVIRQTAEAANIARDQFTGSAATDVSSTNTDSDVPSTGAAADAIGVSVSATIAPAVKQQVAPDTVVFIFARAQQGPPAPLAVKRLRVSDLPTTVRLTAQDAMMPQLSLSLFEDIVVSARISQSGNPIAQPGDFQSELVNTTNTETETINLLISERVE